MNNCNENMNWKLDEHRSDKAISREISMRMKTN